MKNSRSFFWVSIQVLVFMVVITRCGFGSISGRQEDTAAESNGSENIAVSEAADENGSQGVEPVPILVGEAGKITYHIINLSNDETLEYGVVLPDGFDPAQSYPILLALPPGPQSKDMVDIGLTNYWAQHGDSRGWIVLSPAAPNSTLFFRGSETLIPEFLDRMAEVYRPEGGKYHLSGVSNGGISAFRIALNEPDRFHSLIVLPGFPSTPEEIENLASLKEIPVAMFVGERDDTVWLDRMEQTEEVLSGVGGQVTLDVVPDEGHVIRGLAGTETLFDLLESFR